MAKCKKVSGYVLYITNCMIDAKVKQIGVDAPDRMKICASKWKGITEKDRDSFNLEAAKKRALCKMQLNTEMEKAVNNG